MNSLHDIPGTHYKECHVAPMQTADATGVVGVIVAPFKATVVSVEFIPHTTQSGTDTNSRTFDAINVGNSNASVASLALVSGVDLTAVTSKTITVSATAANLNVSAGDVIKITGTKVLTGLALPEGICRIGFKGR